jgi:hypothetical protein
MIEIMDTLLAAQLFASLASPVHLALYCQLRAQPAYTACAHTLAQALDQPLADIAPALETMAQQGLLSRHVDGQLTRYQLNTPALQALQGFLLQIAHLQPDSPPGEADHTAD